MFLRIVLGGDFFSEVVLVEYIPQRFLDRFVSKICLVDVFVLNLFGKCFSKFLW